MPGVRIGVSPSNPRQLHRAMIRRPGVGVSIAPGERGDSSPGAQPVAARPVDRGVARHRPCGRSRHDCTHPRLPRTDATLTTGPAWSLDLDVVRDNYHAFARALPDTRVFYAVKANPAPEVLRLLAELGSCFDTASVAEIEMVLAAGATPDRISFGNTIKKERDIARAYRARRAPLRRRLRGRGREDRRAPRPARAGVLPHPVRRRRRRLAAVAQVRLRARDGDRTCSSMPTALGPRGLRRVVPRRLAADATPDAWDAALAAAAGDLPRAAPSAASSSAMVNLGGGFPTKYLKDVPAVEAYGERDLPGARASTSATASRRRSSSPAAAWSATPA